MGIMKVWIWGCTVEKVITRCDIECDQLELDSTSNDWDF